MRTLLVSGAIVATMVLVLIGWALWVRWRRTAGRDAAWKPTGLTQKAEGYAPELREQTLARREKADRARRHAARVDAGGVRLSLVEKKERGA